MTISEVVLPICVSTNLYYSICQFSCAKSIYLLFFCISFPRGTQCFFTCASKVTTGAYKHIMVPQTMSGVIVKNRVTLSQKTLTVFVVVVALCYQHWC